MTGIKLYFSGALQQRGKKSKQLQHQDGYTNKAPNSKDVRNVLILKPKQICVLYP